jgi:hypothetical protein
MTFSRLWGLFYETNPLVSSYVRIMLYFYTFSYYGGSIDLNHLSHDLSKFFPNLL